MPPAIRFLYGVTANVYESVNDPNGVDNTVINGINDEGRVVGLFTEATTGNRTACWGRLSVVPSRTCRKNALFREGRCSSAAFLSLQDFSFFTGTLAPDTFLLYPVDLP